MNQITEKGTTYSTAACKGDFLGVSVVICAYTERRWKWTRTAVKSALAQRPRPAEVLLVIDNNTDLAARARLEMPEVIVIESNRTPGLSGARNTALSAATQPLIAFLDDDAEARPGWLASLVKPYIHSNVISTGGSIHPIWPELRPRWVPPTFDWVFGCSYQGLPAVQSKVRNPIGANMSMRTRKALDIGGFDESVGRVSNRPQGCEETELAIRLTAQWPKSSVIYVPDAAVDHHVGRERIRLKYFLNRCWHEGLSKATVVRLAGSSAGLERERRHITTVIPLSLLKDIRRLVTGDLYAIGRITITFSGIAMVTTGYLTGHIRHILVRWIPRTN